MLIDQKQIYLKVFFLRYIQMLNRMSRHFVEWKIIKIIWFIYLITTTYTYVLHRLSKKNRVEYHKLLLTSCYQKLCSTRLTSGSRNYTSNIWKKCKKNNFLCSVECIWYLQCICFLCIPIEMWFICLSFNTNTIMLIQDIIVMPY